MGPLVRAFLLGPPAESTIHHVPWIFTKLRPISRAAKFFGLDGTHREQCLHQPIANLARSGKLGQGWRDFGQRDHFAPDAIGQHLPH